MAETNNVDIASIMNMVGPQGVASGRRDRLGAHSGEDGPAVRDRLRAAA